MKPSFRVSASSLFLLILCLPLLVPLAGCSGSADASQLRVTYYYRPGCSDCTQSKLDVAALEKEFEGKVKVESLDATDPEAAQMVSKLGFREHGMVIRSKRGAVLWKGTDHKLKMEEVRQEVQKLLEFQQQAAVL